MNEEPLTASDLFRVVLLNEFAEGAKITENRNTENRNMVTSQFKLTGKLVEHLFAVPPAVVKEHANQDT